MGKARDRFQSTLRLTCDRPDFQSIARMCPYVATLAGEAVLLTSDRAIR